jgi:hypothetical protein
MDDDAACLQNSLFLTPYLGSHPQPISWIWKLNGIFGGAKQTTFLKGIEG